MKNDDEERTEPHCEAEARRVRGSPQEKSEGGKAQPFPTSGSDQSEQKLRQGTVAGGREQQGTVAGGREQQGTVAGGREKQTQTDGSALPPSRRLRVSMVAAILHLNDATSNICRQQMDALEGYAQRHQMSLDLRLFVLGSQIADSRTTVVGNVLEMLKDEHFLYSDLILFHFGFWNPLFDAIHLTPPSARRVVTFHGITPAKFAPGAQRDLVLKSLQQVHNLLVADQIIVQSEFLINELMKLGVAREKLVRVPLSVPFSLGDRLAPTRKRVPDPANQPPAHVPAKSCRSGQIRLAYVGRFVPSKGVHDLIEALGRWKQGDASSLGSRLAPTRKQVPAPASFCLEMCGSQLFSDSDYLHRLRAEIQRLDLVEDVRIHFDLSTDRLKAMLHRADVFVMPSYHEGFCVPVIEAMTQGCFVLSTDAGALPETAGGLGRTYPAGDVEALLARLGEYVHHRQRNQVQTDRGTMSRRDWYSAVKHYLPQYSPKAYMDRFCTALLEGYQPWPESQRDSVAGAFRRALEEFEYSCCGLDEPNLASEVNQSIQDRWSQVRDWLRGMPILGRTCGYVKRLLWASHPLLKREASRLTQNEPCR